MDFSYTIYILIIPIAVFLLLGFFYNKIKPAVAGWIGVAGLTAVAGMSYYTAYQYFFNLPKVDEKFQTFFGFKMNWMNFTDTLRIDMVFYWIQSLL